MVSRVVRDYFIGESDTGITASGAENMDQKDQCCGVGESIPGSGSSQCRRKAWGYVYLDGITDKSVGTK